jgi:hypothetical protein
MRKVYQPQLVPPLAHIRYIKVTERALTGLVALGLENIPLEDVYGFFLEGGGEAG